MNLRTPYAIWDQARVVFARPPAAYTTQGGLGFARASPRVRRLSWGRASGASLVRRPRGRAPVSGLRRSLVGVRLPRG